MGTNTLIGSDAERLKPAVTHVLDVGGGHHQVPPLWDG